MIYRVGITTDTTYSETNKKKTEIKLTSGIIHKLDLLFPSGCQGYLHAHINHGLHQVWPSNPDDNFACDAETISFEEFYELNYDPFVLTVHTWNNDDTYPHLLIVRIGLLPRSAFAPWQTGWEELELL